MTAIGFVLMLLVGAVVLCDVFAQVMDGMLGNSDVPPMSPTLRATLYWVFLTGLILFCAGLAVWMWSNMP